MEELLSNFKYLARNKNGLLFAYKNKPKKDIKNGKWKSAWFNKNDGCYVQTCSFKDVKWEDENPALIVEYIN